MAENGTSAPSVAEMRAALPFIDWDRPIKVVALGLHRWACRICIAQKGLAAREIALVEFAFDDGEDAVAHIVREHGL